MTDQPNFDQRITAAEGAITDALDEIYYAAMGDAPEVVAHVFDAINEGRTRLKIACAVARDYARREQARTELASQAQRLGMYDVTDGHEDDR